jgi:sulfate adenylyltransferase subunit 2
MDHLSSIENRSIQILREAYHRFRNLALMWSIGKDSTTVLWLCRKAFFGELPFPVLHIDTGYKFPEMYEFRDRLAAQYGLRLIVHRNEEALAAGWSHEKGTLECCNQLKTVALQQAVRIHGFDALLLGIRRDEHGIRAKERVFSPRDEQFRWDYENQPAELWNQYQARTGADEHVRVHPLLGWTERDVWDYVLRERMPVNPLYFARDGRRYRSLGCMTCTVPVDSNATTVEEIVKELATSNTSERAGRAQDKENTYTMQKLRALGYM